MAKQIEVLHRDIRPDLPFTPFTHRYEVPIEEEARVPQRRELLPHLVHQREDFRGNRLLHGQRQKTVDRLPVTCFSLPYVEAVQLLPVLVDEALPHDSVDRLADLRSGGLRLQ